MKRRDSMLQSLQDTHASHRQTAARPSVGAIAVVLVVAGVIACAEREMSGIRDGSLLALVTSYVDHLTGWHLH